ncbi:DGQHR domain-containing protein DpdB [Streptomyces sporangiiformans]|uniref:DGQHR domain-containing protein n=1 Tax=Streptomyces sporangiiformans TaxID=2315329 RepID=A0A505DKM9_9ACTN|nr:DGQHR domain-containing protein DpdB [Streptomyces sporangiiformans]TPQ18631.1 DGQHR domain-containing protein [Streptomyces sporangiiformans]
MADDHTLRLPALELRQGSRRIYCFAVDGKKLHRFTAVSRVRRDEDAGLHGYQRPEVLSHIRSIRRYLESDGAMLPNALVLAFDPSVKFIPSQRMASPDAPSTPGELEIRYSETMDESDKPAWLVDGQQRSAAIRDADVAEFPVAAVGFIADNQEDQRSQFILVNSTKPLPKGLIHELLPETVGQLPPAYAKRRLPARLMTSLNIDKNGPFYGRIQSPTSPLGNIKDNSILKMLEHSLFEGALYQYRNPEDGSGDIDRMLLHLRSYWNIVRETFSDAWRLPPRQSRLTHGVGIQAMGFVMDALTEGTPAEEVDSDELRASIASLMPICSWTSGMWRFPDGDQRRWNGLQNTPNDVRLLTNLLVRTIRG